MSQSVVIIGQGISGLCTAREAARRGWDVTVVDRHGPGFPGCSHGNAGMIVPSHFIPLAAPGMVALGLRWMWNPESPFYIRPRLEAGLLRWAWRFWRAATPQHVRRCAPLLARLHAESREAYEELAAAPGMDFGLQTFGLLMLCKTARALEEEAHTAEQALQLGVPATILDAAGAAALDPEIRMDIAGAVHFPRDCHLQPMRLMADLAADCLRAGVKLVHHAEATGWRREGSPPGRLAALKTTTGEFPADEFVLAGGVWSPDLVRPLGLRLPMQAGKGYALTHPAPPQLPRLCSILTEARVAVTPMGSSLRVGGTMELGGVNHAISPRRVQGIVRAVPAYFPAFQEADFDGLQPWCGLRPCPPDGMPFLGRTAAAPNLTIAAGHGMMGLSLGPVTGRITAALLENRPPGHDLTLLSPDRFA